MIIMIMILADNNEKDDDNNDVNGYDMNIMRLMQIKIKVIITLMIIVV